MEKSTREKKLAPPCKKIQKKKISAKNKFNKIFAKFFNDLGRLKGRLVGLVNIRNDGPLPELQTLDSRHANACRNVWPKTIIQGGGNNLTLGDGGDIALP